DLLQAAQDFANQGADLIDLGCTPNEQWSNVGDAVSALRDQGLRVSIDSFDTTEVEKACRAGAEVVLSVNSQNKHVCKDWNVEVVAIPDTPEDKKSFEKTIDFLAIHSVSMRLDPILEPIGCGFVNSLARYIECRKQYPDAQMLMGIGNITELTDADSAGINVLLLGICQELGIQSILTTAVINWARSSVRECHLARQLVHFACGNKIPPKHLEKNLVLLRDERLTELAPESLEALAMQIRDKNIRINIQGGKIHAVSARTHVSHEDPFQVMDMLLQSEVGPSINAAHAFYLGYEMAKAHTANTLAKQYTQDESLDWGFLTQEEKHHRLARTHRGERPSNKKTTDD
ncbi:MAG: dihydropteroate synthase, partial [Planctomycetota bacterium]